MDKEQIIKEWSYNKLDNNYKTNDILSLKVAVFFSNTYNVDLLNLKY